MQIESKWSNHQQAECGPAWPWGHFCISLQPLRHKSWVTFFIVHDVAPILFPRRGQEHEKIGLQFHSQDSLRNLMH